MKVLKTSRRILSLFFLIDGANDRRQVLYCAAFTSSVLATTITAFITSIVTAWKLLATDLEGSLYALFQVVSMAGATYAVVILFVKRRGISAIIDDLSNIYEENKSQDSFELLLEATNTSELIGELSLKFSTVGFILANIALSLLAVFVCWIRHGALDVNEFYHPFRYILPFDQSTIFGYIGEFCLGMMASEAYYITCVFLLLFVSICLHHQVFYEMFQRSINKLEHVENALEEKIVLLDAIRFHVSIKNWFLLTADVYSPLVLVQLITSMLFLACMVFQMDLQLKQIDINILLVIAAILSSSANLFLYCFFGKEATECFEGMADCVYNGNWPMLTVRNQKNVIIMIMNMQKPIYYHGFGFAVLDLETFCKQIRTVSTFYMMFKTVTMQ